MISTVIDKDGTLEVYVVGEVVVIHVCPAVVRSF